MYEVVLKPQKILGAIITQTQASANPHCLSERYY
uniref:Uncharacterized protein n=1 Tax=Anguilla anguilla TaxID=7936 RepID=A0A0E9Q7K0_ANGAN